MALHLVIDAAEGAAGDGSLATDLSLPASADRDEDFDAIRELQFRDHDVLLLSDSTLDGIEAPSSTVDEYGGLRTCTHRLGSSRLRMTAGPAGALRPPTTVSPVQAVRDHAGILSFLGD